MNFILYKLDRIRIQVTFYGSDPDPGFLRGSDPEEIRPDPQPWSKPINPQTKFEKTGFNSLIPFFFTHRSTELK